MQLTRGTAVQVQEDVVTKLHVGRLTRNITDDHLHEIFSTFGKVKSAEIVLDPHVHIARGYGYVEYEDIAHAQKAKAHMDGGQIDGNTIKVDYMIVPRRRSPVPRPVAVRPTAPAGRPPRHT